MGKCLMPQVFVIGGGGDEPIGEGDFLVRFLDFDGTILKQKRVDSGGSVTAPDAPDHTDIGLTFDEWTRTTNNVTSDMDVGATYYTTDGKTHLFIRSTVVTGKDVVLYLNKSDGSTLTVDWGDGSANSTFTNTGNFNTGTHTYANYGDYTIKMWISSGSGTYGFGNDSSTTIVVGGNIQEQRNMLLKVYVGDKVTSIGDYAFYFCYSLTSIIIPAGVTSIGDYAFNTCYSLTSIIIPAGVISISAYVFRDCRSLTSVIPSGVTSISTSAFERCYSLTSVVIPSGVTSISTSAFHSCSSLTNITIPNSVTSIGDSAFQYCYSLTNITAPNSVTSIGSSAFNGCRSLKTYVLERTANITTLGGTDAFLNITSLTKIYVPDALVSTYKQATNWSTYANYIYPISEKGVTHND
jgi:hypothetical protein